MEGVGSIWNKNSWHWEEKNYTPKSKDFLTEKLLAIKFEGFTPKASDFKIKKVNELKGSANISIRKKKQVYIYEWEIECEWEAHEREGDNEANGKVKILEFYQDDDPDDVEIEVTADKSDEYHEEAKNCVRNKIKDHIIKVLAEYKELIQKIDADEAKVRQDAENRMKAEEEMKKAETTAHGEARKKESEQQQRENAMKAAAKQMQDSGKVAGSVWNPNSYFWEEKNFNKWSKDRLQELLGNFKHTVPQGNLEVTEADIKGDSSISIRKGKKIAAFDYEITLKFTITLKEGEEEQKITGEFKIPELSNLIYSDGDEFQVDIEYKTGQEHRPKVADHLKGPVTEAIRKQLTKYSEEYMGQTTD